MNYTTTDWFIGNATTNTIGVNAATRTITINQNNYDRLANLAYTTTRWGEWTSNSDGNLVWHGDGRHTWRFEDVSNAYPSRSDGISFEYRNYEGIIEKTDRDTDIEELDDSELSEFLSEFEQDAEGDE